MLLIENNNHIKPVFFKPFSMERFIIGYYNELIKTFFITDISLKNRFENIRFDKGYDVNPIKHKGVYYHNIMSGFASGFAFVGEKILELDIR